MTGLSIGDGPDPDAAPESAAARARARPKWRAGDVLLVAMPIALALTVLALIVDARPKTSLDLQLFVPPRPIAGRSIAVRAVLLELDEHAWAELRDAPVHVWLEDARGAVRARTRLARSHAVGAEGVLDIPLAPGEAAQIVAEARVAGLDRDARPRTRARVTVAAAPTRTVAGEAAVVAGTLERTIPIDGATPPARLAPRVVGGTCVPYERCSVVVDVGEPAASVRIDAVRGVEVPAERAPPETSGLVPSSLVVEGPEGEIDLVASRGGTDVARRRWTLPVTLAAVALSLDAPIARAPARPRASVDGADPHRGVIVDLFRDGLWERTGSVPRERVRRGPFELPFGPLDPGVYRVQARTDLYGSGSAGTRWLVVSGDRTADSALRAVARDLVRAGYADPFARAVADGEVALATDADVMLAASYLFASGEAAPLRTPGALSGAFQATTGVDGRTRPIEWLAAFAVLLATVTVTAVLLRRGLGAAAEARAVLAAAGDEAAVTAPSRRRMTFTVIAIVAGAALVFVAAAALVLSRGWM